jgi:hypothetical protein
MISRSAGAFALAPATTPAGESGFGGRAGVDVSRARSENRLFLVEVILDVVES